MKFGVVYKYSCWDFHPDEVNVAVSLNANIQVELAADNAKGRVMCFNPMKMAMPDGGTQVYFLGLWYVDEYRRAKNGWRMCHRTEEKSWVLNTSDFMNFYIIRDDRTVEKFW